MWPESALQPSAATGISHNHRNQLKRTSCAGQHPRRAISNAYQSQSHVAAVPTSGVGIEETESQKKFREHFTHRQCHTALQRGVVFCPAIGKGVCTSHSRYVLAIPTSKTEMTQRSLQPNSWPIAWLTTADGTTVVAVVTFHQNRYLYLLWQNPAYYQNIRIPAEQNFTKTTQNKNTETIWLICCYLHIENLRACFLQHCLPEAMH